MSDRERVKVKIIHIDWLAGKRERVDLFKSSTSLGAVTEWCGCNRESGCYSKGVVIGKGFFLAGISCVECVPLASLRFPIAARDMSQQRERGREREKSRVAYRNPTGT